MLTCANIDENTAYNKKKVCIIVTIVKVNIRSDHRYSLMFVSFNSVKKAIARKQNMTCANIFPAWTCLTTFFVITKNCNNTCIVRHSRKSNC